MAAAVTNTHARAGTSVGRKLLSGQNGGQNQLKTPAIQDPFNVLLKVRYNLVVCQHTVS